MSSHLSSQHGQAKRLETGGGGGTPAWEAFGEQHLEEAYAMLQSRLFQDRLGSFGDTVIYL